MSQIKTDTIKDFNNNDVDIEFSLVEGTDSHNILQAEFVASGMSITHGILTDLSKFNENNLVTQAQQKYLSQLKTQISKMIFEITE